MPRIEWVELAGFRAFGKDPQRLEFSSPVAALWGANSQGKPSLAEAIRMRRSRGAVCALSNPKLLAAGEQ
jgi:recombinational DNA repair ATPase RecF